MTAFLGAGVLLQAPRSLSLRLVYVSMSLPLSGCFRSAMHRLSGLSCKTGPPVCIMVVGSKSTNHQSRFPPHRWSLKKQPIYVEPDEGIESIQSESYYVSRDWSVSQYNQGEIAARALLPFPPTCPLLGENRTVLLRANTVVAFSLLSRLRLNSPQ